MSRPFDILLQAVADSLGIPLESDTGGLAVQSGGFEALIRPHPVRDYRLILEVKVMRFPDDAPVQSHLLLHQLNELARLEHDWLVTLDLDQDLILSRSAVIAGIAAADVLAMLSEGVDRAEALAHALRSTRLPRSVPASWIPSGTGLASMMRG